MIDDNVLFAGMQTRLFIDHIVEQLAPTLSPVRILSFDDCFLPVSRPLAL
jgi:hypothetical protein